MLTRRSPLYGLFPFLLAWSLATVAYAQLDEHCVVSILNRTAQVQPDGSFILPNISSNMGQVRARATCVRNGVTTSGQSASFVFQPTSTAVQIPQIVFGAHHPIPSSLGVVASPTTLQTAGATTQLTVTARFPDGSTKNVSAGSTGTNYTNSNPSVATVSPDGLVTAVSSGTVIVSAMNEGALGLIRIQVALTGGDTDGDGIPDDTEIANGLNPNDPTDGFADPDDDGLTNKQELIDFGTDLKLRDTDGDTIKDGEEVRPGADGFVTNPLLRDTDGDGSDDAAEIASGSDPTNPNSRPALTELKVSPATFVLTVNTIIGEASRPLTVTGRRVDGSVVNLTNDPGTNYASSDLTICNFGAEKGRIFAANNGTCTVTITNSGLSTQASVTVQTFAPTALSFVDIPGFANNVDIGGDFAYVAAGATGLQIVDVADRSFPQILGSLDTLGNANDVRVVGATAYVADGAAGLQIIDVTDPRHPTLIRTVNTPGDAQDVVVKGNWAFVADGLGGMQILDVSDQAATAPIGTVSIAGMAKGVDVSSDKALAVVAAGAAGIFVVDVSDATHPAVVGNAPGGDARDVAVRGNFAFVADFSRSLFAVDISDPRHPIVGTPTPSDVGGLLTDVVLVGEFVFGADVFFVNGVPIINTKNAPILLPRPRLDFLNFRDDNGTGIAVDSSYVYLTAESGSITENGTSGTTRLYIGQYLALEDFAGIPPTVKITAPTAAETTIEGATLAVTVEATDDVTVAVVTLLVNGIPVSTDTSAPYQFTITVPTGTSSLPIGAIAGDLGGNIGTAEDVVVNVIPDPLTTAVGRIVDQDTNPMENAAVSCFENSGLTNSTGDFSISALPTVRGKVVCSAIFITPEGKILRGRSARVTPVSGGVTNVGEIRVTDNIGHTRENPAKSCLEILHQGFADGDRKYWIEVPSGVFEMHCDFSSDTGGWTRVGALDGTQNYCTTSGFADMRLDSDASAGKIPDTDTRAIMGQTPDSPHDVMYFLRGDNRYVWHTLQTVADFDTSSKHQSAAFYCPNWHCDNGGIDASVCGGEGDGCPVTAHGISGFTKKIYLDSSFSVHMQGFHSNGGICGLPNYTRASIWVYVR